MDPILLGIVNITRDSFSDGGTYLDPEKAIEKARELHADGADGVDLGAVASNPDAESLPPAVEIARLEPVVAALRASRIPVSIDSFASETQRWALECGVDYLNDIQGFPDPHLYDELAAASCKLIVMHSVQASGAATRVCADADEITDRVMQFLETRVDALVRAGVERSRIILDPGMGFFLGDRPEVSLRVLRWLPELRAHFERPVLISVSRKSFLGAVTGLPVEDRGAASLVAELFAAGQGADYIRTHDVRALRAGLAVSRVVQG